MPPRSFGKCHDLAEVLSMSVDLSIERAGIPATGNENKRPAGPTRTAFIGTISDREKLIPATIWSVCQMNHRKPNEPQETEPLRRQGCVHSYNSRWRFFCCRLPNPDHHYNSDVLVSFSILFCLAQYVDMFLALIQCPCWMFYMISSIALIYPHVFRQLVS